MLNPSKIIRYSFCCFVLHIYYVRLRIDKKPTRSMDLAHTHTYPTMSCILSSAVRRKWFFIILSFAEGARHRHMKNIHMHDFNFSQSVSFRWSWTVCVYFFYLFLCFGSDSLTLLPSPTIPPPRVPTVQRTTIVVVYRYANYAITIIIKWLFADWKPNFRKMAIKFNDTNRINK